MPKVKAKEEFWIRPKFQVSYKKLLGMPGVVEILRFSQKTDRNLGPQKKVWCEFHKGFEHDIERCIVLGHQLASLVKDGFLKE